MYGAGLRAAQDANIPSVCHIREFAQPANGFEFLNEKKQRKTIGKCDHVIFISRAVAERFSDWTRHVGTTVLYDGLKVDRYYQRHAPLFEKTPYRMLLAGHIMPTKGQIEAALATYELSTRGYDVRLTIIGHIKDATYYRKLVELISKLNINPLVEIREFENDLNAIRANSDIALICSTANEGLGRVAIEGMLSGCLVIGSGQGGTVEVVQDGTTGLIYDASSYKSLADCIEYAICNKCMAQAIADYAQSWAHRAFDATTYGERVEEIYRRILANRTNAYVVAGE